MLYLATTATAKEAQVVAGHDRLQWEQFYDRYRPITRKEAHELVDEYSRSWTDIPYQGKKNVHERVNGSLAAEGIPEVQDDLMRWRMLHCIREIRQYAASKQAALERAAAQTASEAPKPSSTCYDLVRDRTDGGSDVDAE
ncbi:hypothetical protein BDV96DRAFT_559125 [Lophiotrema nucula]|uniref:Uncharacterized protein n=1 Tax=Lophiotrema nucula TaxID=690887 RepID=A0A6A5YHL6_9PLEO|nr:hypothetical protein BDV96DRAFT_559125 [Lophiotrema nucula]